MGRLGAHAPARAALAWEERLGGGEVVRHVAPRVAGCVIAHHLRCPKLEPAAGSDPHGGALMVGMCQVPDAPRGDRPPHGQLANAQL